MATGQPGTINRGFQILVLAGLAIMGWGLRSALVNPDGVTTGSWGLIGGVAVIMTSVSLWLRTRPQDQLSVQPDSWTLDRQSDRYTLHTIFVAQNRNPQLEVTLAYIEHPHVSLLSKGSVQSLHTQVSLRSRHEDIPAREDDYWQAYIISPGSETHFEVLVEITGEGLDRLESARLEINYIQYGRQLRTPKKAFLIVPFREVQPLTDPQWQQRDTVSLLPIPTHLLNPSDHLASVIEKYVAPIGQSGDIVAISESAVAVVQGQLRHPTDVRPGWVARRLCYVFPSKTSLSSCYGLQVLIDSSSMWQVLSAFVIGSAAKILRIPGVFYALAGEQSALIDDVTGSLPPYDQFIVLGPTETPTLVKQLKADTGYDVAIVDANDLGEVRILAASDGVQSNLVVAALAKNPAGNSAEQTPIVLIRPAIT